MEYIAKQIHDSAASSGTNLNLVCDCEQLFYFSVLDMVGWLVVILGYTLYEHFVSITYKLQHGLHCIMRMYLHIYFFTYRFGLIDYNRLFSSINRFLK